MSKNLLLPQRRLRLLWDPSEPDPSIQRHPRTVRSQRWSPIDVPLIWSASGITDSTQILDSLIMVRGWIVEPINLYEGKMPARNAARTGWLIFRQILRAWDARQFLLVMHFHSLQVLTTATPVSLHTLRFNLLREKRQQLCNDCPLPAPVPVIHMKLNHSVGLTHVAECRTPPHAISL